jgi:hypothetical protein
LASLGFGLFEFYITPIIARARQSFAAADDGLGDVMALRSFAKADLPVVSFFARQRASQPASYDKFIVAVASAPPGMRGSGASTP